MWNIAGKHVLITGASAGIGKATAYELAARGAILTLAGRSQARTAAVVESITSKGGRAAYLAMDLSDFDSVRSAAQTYLGEDQPLDVLINNAGVGGVKGLSPQGFEIAFATNHLGHHLLTRWLEPRLIESAPGRLIIVASSVHHNVKRIKWRKVRRRTSSVLGNPEYRLSKLANILDARMWSRRLQDHRVDVHAVHPGLVASEIWRDLPRPLQRMFASKGRSIEEGSDTSIWAATDPGLAGSTGGYYGDRRTRSISDLAGSDELAEEMWRRSEEWLADWLPPS
jgi:NAD(P)-dependent dehydrogenase (short-subunit alcohol dehydrogenase family)